MKKKILIPILLIAPLLASCKGMFASVEQAKVIMDNVKSKIKDNSYEKFTISIDEKNGEDHSTISKIIYDKDAKYYHSYEIKDNKIVELWKYAKNNADGIFKFYDCVRYDGAVDEHGYPSVNVVEYDFVDSLWNEVEVMVNTSTNAFLNYAVTTIDSLLLMKDIELQLSSMNDNSLCCEAKSNQGSLNFTIDDSKIVSYDVSSSENNYKKFNCSYSKASVIYLNI